MTDPDRAPNPNIPGNANTPHVHGSAATGIVYTQEHLGRQDSAGLNRAHQHPDAKSDTSFAAASASQLRKASANELTGTPVKNRSGESLGRIKDFVIDTNSGQVVYAVVGSGGIAGIGERLHPVPVQALNHEALEGRESMILDVESSRWAQAPRLQRDRLSSLQQDQQGSSIYEYYGQTWRASSQQSASMNNPVRTQGSQSAPVDTQLPQQRIEREGEGQRLALASDLIGKNIRSGSQTVGEVEDVIVQLESGAAAALLDPNDNFAGSDQKYVVPLHRFTLAENNVLTTSLRESDFKSARSAEAGAWASARQEGESDSLFVYQGGQGAERQGGSRSDSARIATPQQPQRGEAPVAEIRRAIQSDSSLAANQNDIQIEAEGNKLVLRGTVLNEDAKDRIEERAERAAPGWDIDNQIRVATTGMDE